MSNRLKHASSPYLQQHADNPVDWYEWGPEAFAAAKAEGKPLLLSIGYSTCHWCHVMAHESFENAEVAALMNRLYISVKVDREERPDIDAIYMSAVQLLHGHGGWPMTVWLLPDARPYFAATYIPPKDGQRGASMGFSSLLTHMRDLFDNDKARVEQAAAGLTEGVRETLVNPLAGRSERAIDDALDYYRRRFDSENGGLQGAPKFPSSLPVRFLHAMGEMGMANKTLDAMALGGIYDQLAGGFHRYSTDAHWLVPHFEKMLYDNALAVRAYSEGYLLTKKELYAQVCRETCDYVLRELKAPNGLFYSATDADSLTPSGHKEEGWYFSWSYDEIAAALADSERFCSAYGVSRDGNFDGRNVLHGRDTSMREQLRTLLAERNKRPAPHLDDKCLASWNGLMIAALVHAGDALDAPEYVEAGRLAAEAAFTHLFQDGHIVRTGRVLGFLDDYSNMIGACLALFSSTADGVWLARAEHLFSVLDSEFWDAQDGGYFVSSARHETLLAREKPQYDGAEPSGNATMAEHLVELYDWTHKEIYGERLEALFRAFGGVLERAPQALAHMLIALAKWRSPSRELAIVGPASAELRRVGRGRYWLRAVRVEVPEEHGLPVPWLSGKVAQGGKTTAYLCTQQTCQAPVTDAASLQAQLISG